MSAPIFPGCWPLQFAWQNDYSAPAITLRLTKENVAVLFDGLDQLQAERCTDRLEGVLGDLMDAVMAVKASQELPGGAA